MEYAGALIEYSNNIHDLYKSIAEYNPGRKCNVLIVLDDMIADMIINEKLNQIVTELFIRKIKLNIITVFITQSYFQVPKEVILICTRFCIIKIPNNCEFKQIGINHSLDVNSKLWKYL